jgi:hypothetical protein
MNLFVSNNIQKKETIMHIRKPSLTRTILSFLFITAFFLGASMVYAGDTCQIIRIQRDRAGEGSRVLIFPEKVTVPVGTCTVWINFIKDGNVTVSFREDAKQCLVSTDEATATGFYEKELKTGESCYVTETMPMGKTASLYWTEPGVFKFTIESPKSEKRSKVYHGTMLAEGIIEVVK